MTLLPMKRQNEQRPVMNLCLPTTDAMCDSADCLALWGILLVRKGSLSNTLGIRKEAGESVCLHMERSISIFRKGENDFSPGAFLSLHQVYFAIWCSAAMLINWGSHTFLPSVPGLVAPIWSKKYRVPWRVHMITQVLPAPGLQTVSV